MFRLSQKYLFALVLFAGFLLLPGGVKAIGTFEALNYTGGNMLPSVHGFAWSGTYGWISFNWQDCDIDGDMVYETGVGAETDPTTGTATTSPAGCPSGPVTVPYGVYTEMFQPSLWMAYSENTIRGMAWSENLGWVCVGAPVQYVSAEDQAANTDSWQMFNYCKYVFEEGAPNQRPYLPNEVKSIAGYMYGKTADIFNLGMQKRPQPMIYDFSSSVSYGGIYDSAPMWQFIDDYKQGQVFGWMYAPSLGDNGWISLTSAEHPVLPASSPSSSVWTATTSPTSNFPIDFHGWGYGGGADTAASIGWVSFNCAEGSATKSSVCATSPYKVYIAESKQVAINHVHAPHYEEEDTNIYPCYGSWLEPLPACFGDLAEGTAHDLACSGDPLLKLFNVIYSTKGGACLKFDKESTDPSPSCLYDSQCNPTLYPRGCTQDNAVGLQIVLSDVNSTSSADKILYYVDTGRYDANGEFQSFAWDIQDSKDGGLASLWTQPEVDVSSLTNFGKRPFYAWFRVFTKNSTSTWYNYTNADGSHELKPYAWPFPKVNFTWSPTSPNLNVDGFNASSTATMGSSTGSLTTNGGTQVAIPTSTYQNVSGTDYGIYYDWRLCGSGRCSVETKSGFDKYSASTTYNTAGANTVSLTVSDNRQKKYLDGTIWDDNRSYSCSTNNTINVIPNPPMSWLEARIK
ncbi:MAG: hypothetical protein WCK11_05755 [Candidatus Falkowbacteria bacterium]